jgi:hypothetical protein
MPGLTPAYAHTWDNCKTGINCSSPSWSQADLAPLTTTCLALSRMQYVDVILQMTTNWNKVFVMCSEDETGNFTTLVYSILLNNDKNVFKMMQTLWTNSLEITKYARIIHVNLTVIAVTFSQKKLEALLSYHPLYFCNGTFYRKLNQQVPLFFSYHKSENVYPMKSTCQCVLSRFMFFYGLGIYLM